MHIFLTVFWALYILGGIGIMAIVGLIMYDDLIDPNGDLAKSKIKMFEVTGSFLGTIIVVLTFTVILLLKGCIWWYYLLDSKKD